MSSPPLLDKIITRLMRLLTREGLLIADEGMTYLAEPDSVPALTPLQAASCTYRIALGPRAGQKVLSLRSLPSTDKPAMSGLCANAQGFSLVAGLGHTRRCAAALINAENSNICVA